MKKSLLLIIVLFLLNPSLISADEPKPTPPPLPPGEVVILPIDPPGKPRSQCNLYNISAYIDSSCLTIFFDSPEGMVNFTIIDANREIFHEGIYTSCEPIFIDLSSVEAPLEIRISTSEGNEYEGWIE
ncbi:MAG: hypothetical protein K2M06_06205 [Muribaculaceae bacterium]|nr:hypothetical protein [Muribaculaceae bacterium]